ncbi:class A beta-lactamase [Methylobacterium sp. P31]
MVTRRQLTQGFGIALASSATAVCGATARSAWSDRLKQALSQVEVESRGRLGVAVLNTETHEQVTHRGDERFPMCSTFKVLAAAAVLARVDRGEEALSRRIRFEASAVVVNSPVTKDHVGGVGMTLSALCKAAMTMSDNTAGNLLLEVIGGPAGLTQYARSLGDRTTRLDRTEPDLNEALPGDLRDTTSPDAMAANLRQLVFSDVLLPASREQLGLWLKHNKTGDTRLRAGLPGSWTVGDKTGAGDRGTTNDIAVIWPSEGAPLVVAAYLTGANTSAEQRNATIAAVGRAVAEAKGL